MPPDENPLRWEGRMRLSTAIASLFAALPLAACGWIGDHTPDLVSCGAEVSTGARPIAATREVRFLGKVQDNTAKCRGGSNAVAFRDVPWVDWANYWGAGDEKSKSIWPSKNLRGVNGSLIDLEYERIELIKFN